MFDSVILYTAILIGFNVYILFASVHCTVSAKEVLAAGSVNADRAVLLSTCVTLIVPVNVVDALYVYAVLEQVSTR